MADQTSRLILKIEDASKAAQDVDKLADELKRLDGEGSKAARATDKVGDEAKKATPKIDKLGKEATQGSKALRAMGRGAAGAGKAVGALAGLTGLVGIAGIASFTRETLDSIDAIQKLSIQVGFSTEALSQYQFAAQIMGTSLQDIQTSFRYLSRNVSEANQGFGEGKKAFDALNINVAELAKLKPEDQFLVMVEALNRLKDQGDKTATAMRLFGRSGDSILKFGAQGAAGLLALRGEADALAVTLSQDMANAAAQTNDDLTRLSTVILAQKQNIVVQLAPAISSLALFFADNLPKAINLTIEAYYKLQEVATSVVSGIAGGIASVIQSIDDRADLLGDFQRSVANVISYTPAGIVADKVFGLDKEAIDGVADKLEKLSKITGDMSRTYAQSSDNVGKFVVEQTDNAAITEDINRLLAQQTTVLAGGTGNTKAAAAATKAFNSELERQRDALESLGGSIFDQTRTAQESYVASVIEAQQLLAGDFIDQDTFTRYVAQQRDAFAEANSQVDDHTKKLRESVASIRNVLVSDDELFNNDLGEATRLKNLGLLTREELDAYTAYLEDHFERTGYTLANFAEDAGASLQNHFADFLFDPFDKGLSGMVEGFTKSMQRIAAEAAAQEIFENLGGLLGSLGGGGGFFGSIFGFAGDALAKKAAGGPLASGTPTLVGERGPEIIVSHTPGYVVPNDKLGGLLAGSKQNITMNMTVNTQGAQPDKRSLNQVKAAAFAGMRRAIDRSR